MMSRALTTVRVPLGIKLVYTLYMAVLIPVYLKTYGPTNFLYFCDMALFMTWAALWSESAILTSAAAVGIVLPQLLWAIDFLATGLGWPLIGLTGYMTMHYRCMPVFSLSFISGCHSSCYGC
jgi:hypothetical protein